MLEWTKNEVKTILTFIINDLAHIKNFASIF